MKDRKVVHIVKHVPTGAKIPMHINKVNSENKIVDHCESLRDRKGFTVTMLEERWNKTNKEVLGTLVKYKVPGHIDHAKIKDSAKPIDIAIFFEEYILAIEQKEKIVHSKLKSRKLEKFN